MWSAPSCGDHGAMRFRSIVVLSAAALAVLYPVALRRRILTWGATDAEARRASRRRTARGRRRRHHARDQDRRARVRRLAVARADGPGPSRRRVHLRLDREPARSRHAQRRSRAPRVPAPRGRRHDRLRPERMRLERVEPEHVLAWRSEDGNWVWTFVLEEQRRETRLISRNRFRLPTLPRASGCCRWSPAHW